MNYDVFDNYYKYLLHLNQIVVHYEKHFFFNNQATSKFIFLLSAPCG